MVDTSLPIYLSFSSLFSPSLSPSFHQIQCPFPKHSYFCCKLEQVFICFYNYFCHYNNHSSSSRCSKAYRLIRAKTLMLSEWICKNCRRHIEAGNGGCPIQFECEFSFSHSLAISTQQKDGYMQIYIYIYPVLSSIHHKIHYNAMRKNNANNKELKNFLFVLCQH